MTVVNEFMWEVERDDVDLAAYLADPEAFVSAWEEQGS